MHSYINSSHQLPALKSYLLMNRGPQNQAHPMPGLVVSAPISG